MLEPIRKESRVADRLLYVDPYEAVSETVAYPMLYSRQKNTSIRSTYQQQPSTSQSTHVRAHICIG